CFLSYHCFSSFTSPATTAISPLSLHDALPIYVPDARRRGPYHSNAPCCELCRIRKSVGTYRCGGRAVCMGRVSVPSRHGVYRCRSEEHTSELQSRFDLVCRLLLEKKKDDREAR